MMNVMGHLKKIPVFIVFAVAMTACNMNGDSSDNNATDSANNKTDNTAAKNSADTKKARKGKVTTAMGADNNMKIEKGKDGIYSRAEVMPAYPGGQDALAKYVQDNVNYPQDVVDQGGEGTVNISFVVDEKGNVMDPAVINPSNTQQGLNDEAVRVIRQMPKWKPGMVKGKTVKTRLQLPVTFKIEES